MVEEVVVEAAAYVDGVRAGAARWEQQEEQREQHLQA